MADADQHNAAIGFQTLGGEFTSGNLTMRWHLSPNTSFDASPIVLVSKTDTNGPADTKTERYGLNIGLVKNIATMGGLTSGIRFEGGYDYRYDSQDSSAFPQSSAGKGYDWNVGVGPDFEYFIPTISRLSLGAQGMFGYTSSYHSIFSQTAHDQKDTTIGFKGAIFTLRYYYR
jgi:hypothetical protein